MPPRLGSQPACAVWWSYTTLRGFATQTADGAAVTPNCRGCKRSALGVASDPQALSSAVREFENRVYAESKKGSHARIALKLQAVQKQILTAQAEFNCKLNVRVLRCKIFSSTYWVSDFRPRPLNWDDHQSVPQPSHTVAGSELRPTAKCSSDRSRKRAGHTPFQVARTCARRPFNGVSRDASSTPNKE